MLIITEKKILVFDVMVTPIDEDKTFWEHVMVTRWNSVRNDLYMIVQPSPPTRTYHNQNP
jgi:hypothetical protein